MKIKTSTQFELNSNSTTWLNLQPMLTYLKLWLELIRLDLRPKLICLDV